MLDLDYDVLSDGFKLDASNLELAKQAIEGSSEAYDELAEKARQDILIQCGAELDDSEWWNKYSALESAILTGLEDIEVGANLETAGFMGALDQLINSVAMTTA
jgi:hypothetical protein